MKKYFLTMSMLFVMLMALVAVAAADEAKPADTGVDDFKKLLGLSVYFQGGYTYNFINPDPHENDLRVFDHKSNSTTLDLVQLLFNKDAQTRRLWLQAEAVGRGDCKMDTFTGPWHQ